MTAIETDYLVVGAGAAGMAFTDALIASDRDADVVLVDRRHGAGGHWNDAYPFVRLHQPSAFYGCNSRRLGNDTIDEIGPNAGLYERATGAEVRAYFQNVLDEHLVPSGQVRFFGMSEYNGAAGAHRFVSRLTGETTEVTVRRKVVDATYLETAVPATHRPSFAVDPDAWMIPVNGLVDLGDSPAGFTIIGGGKTAMDACIWLLDNHVAPDAIRWIRPRDAWLLDRAYQQPLELLAALIEGVSLNLEAAALAEDVDDLVRRLEACGQLIRLDPSVEPTMYRCATVSHGELDRLREIEHVVRLGRVERVGADRITLTDGSIPTERHVSVDCSAGGLRLTAARPIFSTDRITLQQVRTCQPTFNSALLGYIEASGRDDVDKNRLCPPNPYPNAVTDWPGATYISQRAQGAWMQEPDIAAWLESSRLDAARGIGHHLAEPRMQSALARYAANVEPAEANLEKLLAG